MTDRELRLKYSEICSSLASRRLKPSFDMLGKLIAENGLGIFYDEYRTLEENYHFMLKYTVEGIFDPERQKIYLKLIVSVYELADKINEALRMKFSSSLEYEHKRISNESQTEPGVYISGLQDLSQGSAGIKSLPPEAVKDQQHKIRRFFYRVWFIDRLSVEETEPLKKFLVDTGIPVVYRSYIVTALTLSLLRYFDKHKFALLFDACGSQEPEIKQRALVGLLINIYNYDSRLPYYPDITGRLAIVSEDQGFKRNIERIILQLIRSKETEKLQQRIRDEILPEMIKISPHLKNKINLDSLMEEGLPDDKNPEWEDIFKDSPDLLNKMEEFSEMQMKGADVFMGSFSMLKSFPFFNEPGNWFMPFFPENPEIEEALNVNDQTVKNLLDAIDRAPILCNSDKYSFVLSIQRIPKENLDFMMQAMNAEMEQLKELEHDEQLLDPGRSSEFISNRYIQDLYRFYKLFPRKDDFEDIFNWRFDFYNKLTLGDILKEDRNMLRNIAEYYFAKEYYEDAAEIFSWLLRHGESGEMHQKIAWCHQKLCDFKSALDFYHKAELFDVNQLWNSRKIAACYRNLKNPAKALEYYHAAEKLDPDNLGIQLNIGNCLLELDRWDDALKCFFKVEYLSPGNKKVWRPIAWCSFLTGKKEQAEKYFHKLIDDKPNKHDLINMGHVQWSLGNRKTALDYYQKSISDTGFSEEEFLEVFEADLPHLIDEGIDSDDIPFMLDQLRYFLEE